MKKLFVLLCLSGFAGLLPAQNPFQRNHFLQPDFYTKTLDGAVLANGNLVVVCSAGNRYFFGSEAIWLACFSPEGTLLWDKPAQLGSERLWAAVIFPLPDSTFVLQYQPSGCDFGQPDAWAYFDAEGNRLWHSTTAKDWALPMIPYDQHTFIVANTSGGFYRLGYYGQELDIVDFPDDVPPYDQGYLLLTSGDFVLSSNHNHLYQTGVELTLKKEKSFGKPIAALDEMPGGGLAVLFSDSLLIMNENWEPLQKTALPYEGKKMAIAGDNIFVYAEKNSQRALLVLDSSMQISQQLPVPKDLVYPLLSASGKDLLFWGTSEYPDQNPGLCCKTIPSEVPAFDPCPDLAVVDVRLEDTVRYTPVSWGGPGFFRQIEFGKVVVTLRNEGSQAVESYRLNIKDKYCPGICPGEINLSRTFSLSPLQPGEIEEVVFDNNLFYDCTYPLTELCIWVNGPDNMPDAAPENNRFCRSFVAYLGAEEVSANPRIAVYPNPGDGVIHLPGLGTPAAYRLFDAQGRLVKTGVAESETLDFSGFPEGLYQIQFETADKKHAHARFLIIQP